jgi:acetoin utilization protein AcuB
MKARHIRHIPVMDGPEIFGILSLQDVHDAWLRHGVRANTKAVGEVCTRNVLTVTPVARIADVARSMVDRNVTSALVVDDGLLVGIFTSVDALRVLADG